MANLTVENDILIAPELAFEMPALFGNTGVSADSEGKKIIKAGTPVYGTANVFMNRQTVLTVSGGEGASLYGVARHDIDVTAGTKGDTLLVAGYVDYLKLDSAVQTAVDSASANLPKITFIKGANY